jgi:RNA polymerase sigma factor (sigma-70 family)
MKLTENDNYNEEWDKFIADGNRNALTTIYFHYYDQLFTFGLKHISDKQVVEDSIQTIFLNFIQNRKGIGKVKNLTSYLIASFRHQLFNDLAKQKRTVLIDDFNDEQFDYFKSTEQDNSYEDLEQIHHVVKELMCKLPSKMQEIIFLRFNNRIPYEEIAEMLNISVDSCYKSVYRSIKAIREEAEKILGNGSV